MRRVLSIVAVCGLFAAGAHADLLRWDPNFAPPLSGQVEADGRTRLQVCVPYPMMKLPSVQAARLSMHRMGKPGLNMTALLPIVREGDAVYGYGEATTTLALEDGSYQASVTLLDSSGREVTLPYEQAIVARECGLSGQGGFRQEDDPVSTGSPRWLFEPTI